MRSLQTSSRPVFTGRFFYLTADTISPLVPLPQSPDAAKTSIAVLIISTYMSSSLYRMDSAPQRSVTLSGTQEPAVLYQRMIFHLQWRGQIQLTTLRLAALNLH